VDTAFSGGITDLGLAYVVGIQSSTSLWFLGTAALPSKRWSGRGARGIAPGGSKGAPVVDRRLGAGAAGLVVAVVTMLVMAMMVVVVVVPVVIHIGDHLLRRGDVDSGG
jgi:hypothetical protein